MYWIGRICEEFQCLPSEAYREWRRVPGGFLEQVIEARHYAKTKAHVDAAPDRKSQPTGPLADMVRAIEFQLAADEIAAAKEQEQIG